MLRCHMCLLSIFLIIVLNEIMIFTRNKLYMYFYYTYIVSGKDKITVRDHMRDNINGERSCQR